ncbi:MAG: glycerol-3-phosphate 1-O-acyltransferase PlsY [Steroidobacteraceae bacterium]
MTPVLDATLRVLLAYLLGSVLGSMIVGRLRGGVDIRTLGSGNAGGTNALRTQGKMFGIVVLLIDFIKGWVAAAWLATVAAPESPIREWLPALCATAVVIGHVYPVWFGFRGGKGIATGAGAIVGLHAVLIVPALLVWLAVLVLSGYVGLSSICAALALVAATLLLQPEPFAPSLAFTCVAAVFVTYTHRGNIRRMCSGTESRVRRFSRGAS